MRMRGALAGSALAPARLVCTAGQATPASDTGWFDGHSRDERQAIVNDVYERSGHELPHEGNPETMSGQLTDSVLDAGEDEAPLAGDVGALELVTGTRVGLLARVGAMTPTLWAVGGTFVAGLATGTGVRKLFAELTGPDDAGTGGSPNWTWSVIWRDEGWELWYGATVQQSPGAFLFDHRTSVIMWDQAPCPYSGFTAPTGARMQHGVATRGECLVYTEEGPRLFPTYIDYLYLLETDIRPVAPLRPFDPETDDPDRTIDTPPDPGATAVEDDLDALDQDGNDRLRDQIDWSLTPGSQPRRRSYRARPCRQNADRREKSRVASVRSKPLWWFQRRELQEAGHRQLQTG